jgi:hypothetical protein
MDDLEISEFFDQNLRFNGNTETFSDVQYLYQTDTNQGSYTGQVNFNLTSVSTKLQILSDSYLVLPLRVTSASGTNPYTSFAANKLAIKNSLLSLIQGVSVTTGSGTSFVNETTGATSILANLRLMLESSLDIVNGCGQELHFGGKDTATSIPLLDRTVAPQPTTGNATVDVTSNRGLANRVQCFVDAGTFTNSGFNFVAYIPLKFIHPIFQAMSFPLINLPLLIQFNIAGTTDYSGYQPFTCATQAAGGYVSAAGAATATAALAASDAPRVTINISSTDHTTGFTPNACRLYLKTVSLHAKTAQALAAKVQDGFSKYIDFTVADLFKFPNVAIQGGAGVTQSLSQTITSSAVCPRRIWVLPVATGTLASANNTFPAWLGDYQFSQANLAINSANYYQNNLMSQYEMYQILKDQCPDGQGQISYYDYLNGCNPLVFDISRLKQLDLNAPCSLQFESQIQCKSSTTAFDLLCIVERSVTLKLNFNSSGVTSTLSYGSQRI